MKAETSLNKELLKLSIICFISIFIISLPLKNLLLSLLLSLVYLFFIFLPFLPLITRLKTGLIEKFTLGNIAGLSYGLIFVLLDLLFKVKLTKMLFFIIPMIIFISAYFYAKKLHE